MSKNIYPLLVNFRWATERIHKVAVDPRLVNTIELPLIAPNVCLPQRPSLGQREFLELVPDVEEFIEETFESWDNMTLPVSKSELSQRQL